MKLANITKKYFSVIDDAPSKDCTCGLCKKQLKKGVACKRLSLPCYQKGKLIHANTDDCLKEGEESKWIVSKNSGKPSRNCRQYTMHVIAPLSFSGYFLAYGFTYKKINGNYAKYSLECVNNQTSGSVVSTVLREGFKVFVDDVQVFNHEQFDEESKYIQLHDYTTELIYKDR